MRRVHTRFWAAVVAAAVLTAACSSPGKEAAPEVQGTAGAPPMATPSDWPDSYGLGQPAVAAQVALLDTDIDTTGAGLPEGSGSAQEGAQVYAAKCASCHGDKGQGIPPAPALVQLLVPTDSFPWATKAGVPKTVGNYWPFATTLYGYVWHAMPSTAPGSLSPTEVYQVVAFLLVENQVVPLGTVLDARTLPRVKLPARARLVLDTRRGGREVR